MGVYGAAYSQTERWETGGIISRQEVSPDGDEKTPGARAAAGEALKSRQLLGLTQEELAARMSHLPSAPHPGHISRFEGGLREPNLIYLLEFSRLSGVTLECLLDDEMDVPNKLKKR